MILGRLLLAMCGAEAQRTVRSHRCPGPDWQLLLDPGTHCYKKLPHGYPRSVIELKLGVLKLAVYRGWAFEIPKKVSRTRSTCKTSSADKWSRKRTRCWFDGRSQRDLDWCQERWNKYKTDQVKGVRQRSFPIVARDTLAKSSSRLKYNRMSAQTRRLISRPKNESGSEIDCQLTGNPDRPFPGSLFWKIFSLKFIWLDFILIRWKNFGKYVFVKRNAEWYFFKDNFETKLRRGVICQGIPTQVKRKFITMDKVKK